MRLKGECEMADAMVWVTMQMMVNPELSQPPQDAPDNVWKLHEEGYHSHA